MYKRCLNGFSDSIQGNIYLCLVWKKITHLILSHSGLI